MDLELVKFVNLKFINFLIVNIILWRKKWLTDVFG